MATNNASNTATGASGTVLTGTGVGSTPTFQAPAVSGDWVLLDRQFVNGGSVSDITFTSFDTTNYGNFVLVGSMSVAGDGDCVLQVSLDNGGTWRTSGYTGGGYSGVSYFNYNATAAIPYTNDAGIPITTSTPAGSGGAPDYYNLSNFCLYCINFISNGGLTVGFPCGIFGSGTLLTGATIALADWFANFVAIGGGLSNIDGIRFHATNDPISIADVALYGLRNQ